MKAAVFRALGEPLRVQAIADPVPAAGEVVVRVERCGVCGSDLHMTEDPVFGVPPGAVLGHEYTGEIVAAGPGADRHRIGDRVVVLPFGSCGACASCLQGDLAWCTQMQLQGGGYAQYACVHERQCVRVPAGLSSDDAALVEPLAVGLHGVDRAQLRPGDKVLVIGAGPIGLATVFWARRLGAGRIAVTASSHRRAAMAEAMGADCFVDPEDNGADAVARALGGAPDVVFECVGKPGLIERSIECVRPRGTVTVLGLCTAPDRFNPFAAISKEVRIQMAVFYSVRDFEYVIDTLARGAGQPRAMVTDRVSLDELPSAFEALRARTSQCKVLVTPW